MAILRVAQMGHPVLRLIAEPVDPNDITTVDFQRFLDDMLETMEEYDGAGLAAPQVYTSIRVVVLTLDEEPEFLINPEITVLSEGTSKSVEGCLSVEDIRGVVERPNHIRLDAYGRDGAKKSYELRGFPAVVTQHECDHLDGVLYVDRADPLTLAFLREYHRFGRLDRYVDDYEADEDVPDEIIVLPVDEPDAPSEEA